MLLQIHEPGQTPLPHEGEVAIGIDLGTTNSLVAISHEEVAEVLTDKRGEFIVPSVIGPLYSLKRLMGMGYEEGKDIIKNFGFPVIKEKSDKIIRLKLGESEITPVEFSAEILKQLKKNAETALGKQVNKAVITVPAYFNESQRTATKDAAKLAGLEVLRLINEPTAAAIAYGLDKKAEGTYAVYDLGGGTFDVSILKMQMGVFKVIATGGDTQLGGDDFDLALAMILKQKSGVQKSLYELKPLARKVKEDLSFSDEVNLSIPSPLAGEGELPELGSGKKGEGNREIKTHHPLTPTPLPQGEREYSVSRSEFERIIGDMADKTIHIFERVLKDAKLKPSQLTGVIMVGGSTRIPFIRNKIEQLTGKKPLVDIDPDKVVAMGAAIQAEALTRGSNNLLLDVTPLSLGLETYGGLMEVLIQRNTPIPAVASQKFTTYEDGQTGIKIHVLQGERELAANCRSLSRFELKGIPPQQAGTPIIEVKFMLDADGILTVSALEEKTGTQAKIEVRPSYGLDSEEMEKILVTSMQQAKADIMARLLQESRVEAGIAIKTIESALKKDGNLISDEYKEKILAVVAKIRQSAQGENRELIDIEVKNLDMVAGDFADVRTSNALKGYLAGKKVSEF